MIRPRQLERHLCFSVVSSTKFTHPCILAIQHIPDPSASPTPDLVYVSDVSSLRLCIPFARLYPLLNDPLLLPRTSGGGSPFDGASSSSASRSPLGDLTISFLSSFRSSSFRIQVFTFELALLPNSGASGSACASPCGSDSPQLTPFLPSLTVPTRRKRTGTGTGTPSSPSSPSPSTSSSTSSSSRRTSNRSSTRRHRSSRKEKSRHQRNRRNGRKSKSKSRSHLSELETDDDDKIDSVETDSSHGDTDPNATAGSILTEDEIRRIGGGLDFVLREDRLNLKIVDLETLRESIGSICVGGISGVKRIWNSNSNSTQIQMRVRPESQPEPEENEEVVVNVGVEVVKEVVDPVDVPPCGFVLSGEDLEMKLGFGASSTVFGSDFQMDVPVDVDVDVAHESRDPRDLREINPNCKIVVSIEKKEVKESEGEGGEAESARGSSRSRGGRGRRGRGRGGRGRGRGSRRGRSGSGSRRTPRTPSSRTKQKQQKLRSKQSQVLSSASVIQGQSEGQVVELPPIDPSSPSSSASTARQKKKPRLSTFGKVIPHYDSLLTQEMKTHVLLFHLSLTSILRLPGENELRPRLTFLTTEGPEAPNTIPEILKTSEKSRLFVEERMRQLREKLSLRRRFLLLRFVDGSSFRIGVPEWQSESFNIRFGEARRKPLYVELKEESEDEDCPSPPPCQDTDSVSFVWSIRDIPRFRRLCEKNPVIVELHDRDPVAPVAIAPSPSSSLSPRAGESDGEEVPLNVSQTLRFGECRLWIDVADHLDGKARLCVMDHSNCALVEATRTCVESEESEESVASTEIDPRKRSHRPPSKKRPGLARPARRKRRLPSPKRPRKATASATSDAEDGSPRPPPAIPPILISEFSRLRYMHLRTTIGIRTRSSHGIGFASSHEKASLMLGLAVLEGLRVSDISVVDRVQEFVESYVSAAALDVVASAKLGSPSRSPVSGRRTGRGRKRVRPPGSDASGRRGGGRRRPSNRTSARDSDSEAALLLPRDVLTGLSVSDGCSRFVLVEGRLDEGLQKFARFAREELGVSVSVAGHYSVRKIPEVQKLVVAPIASIQDDPTVGGDSPEEGEEPDASSPDEQPKVVRFHRHRLQMSLRQVCREERQSVREVESSLRTNQVPLRFAELRIAHELLQVARSLDTLMSVCSSVVEEVEEVRVSSARQIIFGHLFTGLELYSPLFSKYSDSLLVLNDRVSFEETLAEGLRFEEEADDEEEAGEGESIADEISRDGSVATDEMGFFGSLVGVVHEFSGGLPMADPPVQYRFPAIDILIEGERDRYFERLEKAALASVDLLPQKYWFYFPEAGEYAIVACPPRENVHIHRKMMSLRDPRRKKRNRPDDDDEYSTELRTARFEPFVPPTYGLRHDVVGLVCRTEFDDLFAIVAESLTRTSSAMTRTSKHAELNHTWDPKTWKSRQETLPERKSLELSSTLMDLPKEFDEEIVASLAASPHEIELRSTAMQCFNQCRFRDALSLFQRLSHKGGPILKRMKRCEKLLSRPDKMAQAIREYIDRRRENLYLLAGRRKKRLTDSGVIRKRPIVEFNQRPLYRYRNGRNIDHIHPKAMMLTQEERELDKPPTYVLPPRRGEGHHFGDKDFDYRSCRPGAMFSTYDVVRDDFKDPLEHAREKAREERLRWRKKVVVDDVRFHLHRMPERSDFQRRGLLKDSPQSEYLKTASVVDAPSSIFQDEEYVDPWRRVGPLRKIDEGRRQFVHKKKKTGFVHSRKIKPLSDQDRTENAHLYLQ